uniref:Uncharacterized protein n=1 Tax=Arundo donax TaxID=35708 RepID=A0A0A9CEJ2_ARUDO
MYLNFLMYQAESLSIFGASMHPYFPSSLRLIGHPSIGFVHSDLCIIFYYGGNTHLF